MDKAFKGAKELASETVQAFKSGMEGEERPVRRGRRPDQGEKVTAADAEQQFAVRLPADLIEQVLQRTAESGQSPSELTEGALRRYLADESN